MTSPQLSAAPSDPLDRDLAGVVGGKTAKALEKAFDMHSVRDLLWHFPRRYSNRGELTPLTGLPVGEHVTVMAQVIDVRERSMQKRHGKILEVRITDGQGSLSLTFFNQAWRASQLFAGKQGIFSGKVSEYRGNLQLQHPDYQLFDDRPGGIGLGGADDETAAGADMSAEKSRELQESAAKAWADRPIPIYPATATLPSWSIEKAVGVALEVLPEVEDPLPPEIRRSENVFELRAALEQIHRPERNVDWKQARDSMRFREAFELQLALLDRRRRAGLESSEPRPPRDGGLRDRFDAALPFALTGDQRAAGERIALELSEPHPMHRLLQGEVGSGKTIVALRAMLQVAEGGGQSALLAPTEVLASQHYRSIVDALGPQLASELNPVLVTGSRPASERQRALLSLASGNSRIAIGTHALLSEGVTFYDLGLVIIDEQHRFGVEQRETLRRKGAQPHVLAMTATPIPRTVALTAFGDLEVTTIRELPPGRLGIESFTVPQLEMPARFARVWTRTLEEVASGRQVYIVCPAIAPNQAEAGLSDADPEDGSGSEAVPKPPMVNVEETVAWLQSQPEFAGIRVAALTGAMKGDAKDAVMSAFVSGEVQVLVATTVIEVGVNVPNASTMIVLDADRFGISQLHQLRGRVGRGEHAGLCLLVTRAAEGTPARARVDAVAETTDGFVLAEVDLEQRREGNILGTEQSGGKSTLRLLRVAEHGDLIEHARGVAGELLDQDPELARAPGLRRTLERETRAGHLENLAKS
ncbi:ATP-dependent DNA helicase RecG [Leucobacter tardus]|uniref:Probable DNA 3'-5' helicase RecG n=1 Tax=Leucobacter tardus TaxID=501483 RepID=A0A939QLG1_9MICO|nr:ATP-dependent DNA helicase RecG [Leucobacter tardus]MBO2989874.1 ATP-dependent DNA helicase RecG [Leucobacter tardus]